MLNEPASSRHDQPVVRAAAPTPDEQLQADLRAQVATVLAIQAEVFAPTEDEPHPPLLAPSRLVATFEGALLLESEAAYDKLDALLAPSNHFPVFRPARPERGEAHGPHIIQIISGRINPAPRAWWPNVLLFIATLFSLLLVGTDLALGEIASSNPFLAMQLSANPLAQLWRGLPYALSLLLILSAHELGHYFAARWHRLAVTLPYFIPLPFISLFGTMGAFIQLRQPMKNRKMLLDVGASGPLAGLVFAVPILLIGLTSTRLIPILPGGVYEGDSVVYALAKILVFGRFVPDGQVDVCINCSQLAWAGWTGLLVTALNLIPIGQLDGGHVLYALVGERARRLFYPLLAAMIALVFFTDVWLFWVLLLLIFGRVYATPLDTITPLDKRRRAVAVLALVVFVLIFVPAPLAPVGRSPLVPLPGGSSAGLLPLMALGLVAARRWRR